MRDMYMSLACAAFALARTMHANARTASYIRLKHWHAYALLLSGVACQRCTALIAHTCMHAHTTQAIILLNAMLNGEGITWNAANSDERYDFWKMCKN